MAIIDVTIRDARPDEAVAVAEVIDAAYSMYDEQQRALGAERWTLYREYRESMLNVAERMELADVLVAESGGRLVGTVTFYRPGEAYEEGWDDTVAGVRLLAVHPGARGAGIGRRLTQECIDRALMFGARALGLHTTEFMAVARELYVRMGFIRTPEFDLVTDDGLVIEAYRLEL
ncbi:MAG TPA: GNAT family N-acetyltransferase [Actinomycetota bacterium]